MSRKIVYILGLFRVGSTLMDLVLGSNPRFIGLGIDIAVFQNSGQGYLPLSLKYRKLVRELSKTLPIEIFPVKEGAKGAFLDEIEIGETIYERGN